MQPWYTSKTVWFNAITSIVAILTLVPQVSGVLPDEFHKYILLAVGALNVVLRIWFTDSPVTTPVGSHVKL